jgi:ferredoxin/flavodoxin
MVFYFSGTGNSRWVARTVADSFNDKLVAMGDYFRAGAGEPSFSAKPDEKIGFIFPVHSWGIPPLVRSFIGKLLLNGYNGQLIYGIFTCGDECGNTRKMFLDLLAGKGWRCHHAYSITMPNSYICLPGFDVDPKEVELSKRESAKEFLPRLIRAIAEDSPVESYTKGSFTSLKSGLIYKMFCKYAIDARPYRVTDNCDSCGVCAKRCPTGNIALIDGKPVWSDNCTQCLACIHYCPSRAIEYGKATVNKGRYTY